MPIWDCVPYPLIEQVEIFPRGFVAAHPSDKNPPRRIARVGHPIGWAVRAKTKERAGQPVLLVKAGAGGELELSDVRGLNAAKYTE